MPNLNPNPRLQDEPTPSPAPLEADLRGGCACPQCGAKLKVVAAEPSGLNVNTKSLPKFGSGGGESDMIARQLGGGDSGGN